MFVSGFESVLDGMSDFSLCGLPCAETDQWDRGARVEFDGGCRGHFEDAKEGKLGRRFRYVIRLGVGTTSNKGLTAKGEVYKH